VLKILYALIVLLGTVFGVTLAFQVETEILVDVPGFAGYSRPQALLAILLGGLGYLISATLSWELEKWAERQLPRLRIRNVIWGVAGLLSGLVASTLFLIPVYFFVSADPVRQALGSSSVFQTLAVVAPPFVMILFGYLGVLLFLKKQADATDILPALSESAGSGRIKVLDTSAIIDGRILDLIRSGIVEGPIAVPQAVLSELQYVADAHDQHRRARGKRGLEVLEALRKVPDVTVHFPPDTLVDLPEVDAKLVRMCRELNAVLVTNDMNLHKLARLQEVRCVNLHEVANALRPVILPGEELEIQIVKKGKEARQGVGYLNDGSMIVVENGAAHLGETRRVQVTSVLQTSAGRMIFARVGDERQGQPASSGPQQREQQPRTVATDGQT
jgi:uncharacterized protein YacL